jgi:hypothetical protein
LIVNILVGTSASILAVFVVAFSYILVEAFRLTSFNMSLSTSPTQVATNFQIYAFISVEATFVALMIAVGYYILRNALKRNVIEIDVN